MGNHDSRTSVAWPLPLLACLVIGPAAAHALGTTLWHVDTAEQLEEGELDQVMVSSDGEVRLGRSADRVELTDVALVWSIAEGAKGAVYLGTGNNGRVLRLVGSKVEEVARLDTLVVSSLALGAGGELFAGTLPGGKIYRLEPEKTKSKATVFAELEKADHIWALAWDPAKQVLYAGTGAEGLVYAIDRRGRASVYYDSEEEHVLTVRLGTKAGQLLAGTSPGARLLSITGPGRATALHDFDATEVKGIATDGDDVYVAVNEFPRPPAPPKRGSTKASTATKHKSSLAARPKPGKGRLFRRRPDGSVERLLTSSKTHLTSVEAPGDGLVYAGTGSKGRVVAVDGERRTYTVLDLEERQVLALGLGGASPVVATGDAGAVYRVGAARAATAEYRTAPLDAEFLSRWGALDWRGSGSLVVQTRSGNTEEPDQTWSDWSAPLARPGAAVTSPAARYLQARARWSKDPAAVLRALGIFHLPSNQRPVLTKVEVETPYTVVRPAAKATGKGKGSSKRGRSTSSTKRRERSPMLKVTWKVRNPDDDELRYRLHVRRESETEWQSILPEEEVLSKTSYDWNTESMPSGYYLLRVTASDEPSNPAGRALSHSKTTPPIVVDNDPPRFRVLEGTGRRITGRVVDGFSPVAAIDYSLDGRIWHPVFPADDIFDATEESFSFELPASVPAGPRTVAVRARDGAGNAATGRVALTVP